MGTALDLYKLIEAVCIGLVAIGGGVAIVIKCVKTLTDQHDRREKYDGYDDRINALGEKIDELEKKHDQKFTEAHNFAHKELQNIKKEMTDSIDEYQTNMGAKLQQISSELCMLSYCTLANLDGLKQLNCNGKVTEAREKMEKHLNQQAHGEI